MENEIEPITKPKKWNTNRVALYCGFIGLAVAVVRNAPDWGVMPIDYNLGTLTGGAVGGAVVGAITSGLRNLFVR